MFLRTDKTVILSDLEKLTLNKEAKDFANETRAKNNIEEIKPYNVVRFIEDQGYFVFQILNLGTSGFIRIVGKHKVIFLNASESLGRQYYTAIHEYCHLIKDLAKIKEIDNLSEEEKEYEMSKMEYFAYKFTDYFLMPESALLNYLKINEIHDFSKITIKNILGVQHHFQLSFRQTTRMLNKYEVISKEQRDEFNSYSSKDNPELLKKITEDNKFPLGLISPLAESRIPDIYLDSIIDNIKKGRITRKKVLFLAELLQKPSLVEVGPNHE
ncbi:ImmA/IrrE family metallo-endopeptidase [Bacillus sp. REN16]|uniref:ImmA/IrrE family metallo-endopeptidase n=1 Tax=Bacillus sp. REN16 TaxID=2887296 RepID=UPI001E2DC185|nr:ImmA/IrrE family metallo-endopeptidase [Bacillus sp. REN16]MCC3359124.1 ImmA/IrrE family metallo-endopeptidase [Bacillus sp. REN16]